MLSTLDVIARVVARLTAPAVALTHAPVGMTLALEPVCVTVVVARTAGLRRHGGLVLGLNHLVHAGLLALAVRSETRLVTHPAANRDRSRHDDVGKFVVVGNYILIITTNKN